MNPVEKQLYKLTYCQCCQTKVDYYKNPDRIALLGRNGYIVYCSEKCMKKHNHKYNLVKNLHKRVKKLEKLNKKYLFYLKSYGYGQS